MRRLIYRKIAKIVVKANFNEGDTITILDIKWTFRHPNINNEGDVLIGRTVQESQQNFINSCQGVGTGFIEISPSDREKLKNARFRMCRWHQDQTYISCIKHMNPVMDVTAVNNKILLELEIPEIENSY